MTDPKDTSNKLPLLDNGVPDTKVMRPGGTSGRRRLILVPAFFAVLFLGGLLGLYFQPPGMQAVFRATGLEPGGGTDTPMAVAMQRVTDEEEVAVISEGDVVALGRIIPRSDIITVATPFGAGDARLAELSVTVGDVVEKGQVVAVLDSLSQFEGVLETARANVAVSSANLRQTRSATRASREEAVALLERALATETVAVEELERASSLLERGVTTKAVLDSAIARATEAARDVEKARATLSRYDPDDNGIQADIAVAEASLQAAQAELAQAQRDIEKAYVRASISGTVLEIHARPGERPGTDGVLDLGDISQMSVEAEVYQSMTGRVAGGDPVTATAGAVNGALTGQVSAIGLEIGRQSITSDDPAANTDARVVDVIVMLDQASSEKAKRLTNLQVVARIDAGRLVQ